ncbi:MAG: TolB family protein, partial [Blastocatellia bacterium]
MSLTEGSRVMVTVQSETTSSIWVVPQNDASRARRITSGKYDGSGGLAWTPDGRIVYEAKNASGTSDLWTIDPNSGHLPKRLTENAGVNRWPTVSPDGRFIVFESNRSGAFNIWRIDQDGSNPKQMTQSRNSVRPDCTPDGKWVVYQSLDSGKLALWKVLIDGGIPLKLTDRTSITPVASPDGKLIAYLYANDQTALPSHLAVMPLEAQSPEKVFDVSPIFDFGFPIRWTPDGRALAYIHTRNGVSNIWSYPLAG